MGVISSNELIDKESTDFTRSALGEGTTLSLYLHHDGGNVRVNGGSLSSQEILSLPIRKEDKVFVEDIVLELGSRLDLDFHLKSKQSEADIRIFYDTEIILPGNQVTLGLAVKCQEDDDKFWEIFINTPEFIGNEDYLRYALIHELGHTLGLEHPFDDSDGDVVDGITLPWKSLYPEDTVMAYRNPISGSWPQTYTDNDWKALSTIWGSAENHAGQEGKDTGDATFSISGTTSIGNLLTINQTATDPDNGNGTVTYRWQTNSEGSNWIDVGTGTTFNIAGNAQGKKIRVIASYIDNKGFQEVVTTDAGIVSSSVKPTQKTYTKKTTINFDPGSDISLPLLYNTSDNNGELSGLTLNIHYNSSFLTPIGTRNGFTAIESTFYNILLDDTDNKDNDVLTDKIVKLTWRDSGSNFPSGQLPTNLGTMKFSTNAVDNQEKSPQTPTSTHMSKPNQFIYTEKQTISYKPGANVCIPLLYTTSDLEDDLSGLTLNIHYNSARLTPSGDNNGFMEIESTFSNVIIDDVENSDQDPLTNKIIQLSWLDFKAKFPKGSLPVNLGTIQFNSSNEVDDNQEANKLQTTTRYTASETASGYDFLTGETVLQANSQPSKTNVRYTASATATGYDFLTGMTTLEALDQSINLDVDGDGKVTPLGDGLMLIRKMIGPAFADDALTNKASSAEATRSANEIHDHIQKAIDSGALDVDGDGKTTPLGDGLMIIRNLIGPAFAGDALINKALSTDSPHFGKTDASDIVAANIEALKPPDN